MTSQQTKTTNKGKKNSNIRILVVEDDLITTFITSSFLKKHYNFDSVTSGYAALNALEENNYDVILMDINLGDLNMDGIKTMRQIRMDKKHRDSKIIAVTGFANNEKWYVNQGFDALFLKPLEEDKIVGWINKYAEKKLDESCVPELA